MTSIEVIFGARLGVEALLQARSVRGLSALLAQTNGADSKCLTALQPGGDGVPFFCIHGLTGDVLWYGALARLLGPRHPFYGIRAPALADREPPLGSIEAMARRYVGEIRGVQPQGPYALGGASLGGTLALEVAQQLFELGEEVAVLAIFDHVPAHQRRRRAPLAPRALARFLRNLPPWTREFAALDAGRRKARVARKLRAGTSRIARALSWREPRLEAAQLLDYGAELPEHRKRLVEANLSALNAYEPRPYPGRVVLFKARTRPLLSLRDPEVGWKELAQRGVEVIDVPASHEGMFQEPSVSILAVGLRRALEAAETHNAASRLSDRETCARICDQYVSGAKGGS